MRQVVINEQGLYLHAEGDSLIVSRAGIEFQRIRLGEIETLTLLGRVEISSGAVAILVQREIPVIFLTEKGRFRARLWTRTGPDVLLRQKQFEMARDPDRSIILARAMVRAKVEHQRRILLRAQRKWKDESVAGCLARMRSIIEEIDKTTDPGQLLGREGQAAALYFRHFGRLITKNGFEFGGRSRRPPLDPPNACLSFGYALLGTVVETEVLRRGLDPFVGMFHTPRYNRASLVLDLLEEWRPLVDQLTVRLINLGQLCPGDFENPIILDPEDILLEPTKAEHLDSATAQAETAAHGKPAVHLNATGRKIFLTEFYGRLKERLHYPLTGQSLEIREIIGQQVNLMARTINDGTLEYKGFVPD
jgi:CRISPR-associated protein Cas1